MKTTFQLDGCHSLTILTNPPRVAADRDYLVWVQVDRQPLPTPEQMEGRITPSVEVVASFGIRPGEARTIASALITAAQSAR